MAGLVVCKVQVPVHRPLSARLELSSPSLGGAGPSTAPRWAYIGLPNGHFLSWPGVTCSPNCLQTPRHLPTPLPLLMQGQLLDAVFTLSELTPEESVHYQEHKSFNARGFVCLFSFFSRSFLMLPCPMAWEGRGAQSQTGAPLFEMPKALGSLYRTEPPYLFVDCPAYPQGLLTASNLSSSPNARPGTTSSLEPTSGQGPRELGLCTSVQTS